MKEAAEDTYIDQLLQWKLTYTAHAEKKPSFPAEFFYKEEQMSAERSKGRRKLNSTSSPRPTLKPPVSPAIKDTETPSMSLKVKRSASDVFKAVDGTSLIPQEVPKKVDIFWTISPADPQSTFVCNLLRRGRCDMHGIDFPHWPGLVYHLYYTHGLPVCLSCLEVFLEAGSFACHLSNPKHAACSMDCRSNSDEGLLKIGVEDLFAKWLDLAESLPHSKAVHDKVSQSFVFRVNRSL